jgi:hypothetical protein
MHALPTGATTMPAPRAVELADTTLAAGLMLAFAARTGLSSATTEPRRYLWTDAFAVCNCLALGRGADADAQAFRALAAQLVEQVHHVLGHHRPDDVRQGWISGLPDAAGEAQPTVGGLRIGKPLPERDPRQPYDAELEWERDGQYFHYLTRWMHALDQFAHASGHPDAERWACELAQAAVVGFSRPTHGARLVWKMSIDLSHAAVASSGQHDALDGLVTCLQLQARRDAAVGGPELTDVIAQLAAWAGAGDWRTDDPLGLGGLLADAWRLMQLPSTTTTTTTTVSPLLERMLDAAGAGLDACARQRPWQRPPSQRLAFRELGLAIGLQAVGRMQASLPGRADATALQPRLRALSRHAALAADINACWREPAAQRSATWRAHEDINAVMLATSLVPSGYLDLA